VTIFFFTPNQSLAHSGSARPRKHSTDLQMTIKKSSGGKPAPRWPLDPNALQKAAVFLSTPFAMKQSTTNQDIFPAAFRGSKARYISISSQRRSLARTTLAECKTNANSKSQSEIQHPSLRMNTLIAVHKELPAIAPRGVTHRFFRGTICLSLVHSLHSRYIWRASLPSL